MKCSATKSDGAKCQANALQNSDACFRHDKAMKHQALRASSEGGQAKRQYVCLGAPARIKTPKDIQNLMSRAINSLWTGNMPSHNPAGALGYLAKIFLEAHDKSELEKRVELIEKRLEEAKI